METVSIDWQRRPPVQSTDLLQVNYKTVQCTFQLLYRKKEVKIIRLRGSYRDRLRDRYRQTGERERERQRDRQKVRQKDRQKDRLRDKQKDRLRDTQRKSYRDRQRQTGEGENDRQ